MKRYIVTYISANGNRCEATFKSERKKGSKANLADAKAALRNHYGVDVETVNVRAAVSYEPDTLVLN